MLRKTGMLSLLSATLLGVVSLPVQADNATVQTGTQQVVINGNNNQVIQVINQTNVNQRSGRGRRRNGGNNRATIQDAYQGASVNGQNNTVFQESNQTNIQQESRGRRRRPDREREEWDDDEPRGRGRRERGDDDDDD
ncbi:MAG: hypothetical protein QNJ46_08655 [Leptolyngbyaceae cyanobacterium MO_188.B28]|nr:hypothetical protein [Leptolyngbyaceae cyanobacterium MO_188.B28]